VNDNGAAGRSMRSFDVVVSSGRSTNDQVEAARCRTNSGILGCERRRLPYLLPRCTPFGRSAVWIAAIAAFQLSPSPVLRHARSELLVRLLALAHQRVPLAPLPVVRPPESVRVLADDLPCIAGSILARAPADAVWPPAVERIARPTSIPPSCPSPSAPAVRSSLHSAPEDGASGLWHMGWRGWGPAVEAAGLSIRLAVWGFGWLNGRPGDRR
jgi:hypothetical protein